MLNVSCPDCGKRFDNIRPELAGKKARCSCGRVIRLGGESSGSQIQNPTDPERLMSVDLLGDELLGDQLLSGQGESDAKDAATPVKSQPRSKEDVPIVPVAKSRSQSRDQRLRRKSKKPQAVEAFSDLDSILEGVGDASPILARPQVNRERRQNEGAEAGPRATETPRHSIQRSIVGFVAALLSATLAFWFGVFAVISRFEVIDHVILGRLSTTLNSVYRASLGDAEVPARIQTMFVSLGWAFWGVMLLLILFGVAQFCSALFKVVAGRHLFSWCDGLTASLGVVALFLMVCMTFTHISFQRHHHKFFDDYEKSAVAEGGHLENVTVIRGKFDRQQAEIRTDLILSAVISATVFGISMVRLFASSGED